MIETRTDFDARQALVRISEMARSAAARAGGKGKKFKPEDQRQVAESLAELLVHSALPLAEIAQSIQNVSRPFYAETLGEIWTRMPSERRNDATHWIEGLPKDEGNIIRRLLVPLIAEQDPKSARLILPGKPKALDSAEDRERFAKNWLGRDIGPFGPLLAGELVEYEVTRVLRMFLRLASEPVVTSSIRSQSIRAIAQALEDRKLSRDKGAVEQICTSLVELIGTLPSAEASATNEYLLGRTPLVASRLNLKLATRNSSPPVEIVVPTNEPTVVSSETKEESSEVQLASEESRRAIDIPKADRAASSPDLAAEDSSNKRPGTTTAAETKDDDITLVSSLEMRAREHRESALLLEAAVSRLKTALATIATLEINIATLKKVEGVNTEQLQDLQTRVESLSKELFARDEQLKQTIGDLRKKETATDELQRSADSLTEQLTDARTLASATQSRLDAVAASHKTELDTVLQRVAGQTDQRLEEFRNDLGRRVSEILRGTPAIDSGNSAVDGKVILFRLWELIEALKRKSVPIRTE